MRATVLTCLATFASGLAGGSLYPFEGQSYVPPGWTYSHPASPSHVLHLTISLTHRSPSLLAQTMEEISDPTSSRYRQYVNAAELAELTAPRPNATQTVLHWLGEAGLTGDAVGSVVKAYMTVAHAERLLNASYGVWTHESGRTVLRVEKYYLPKHLHKYIDTITPTVESPLETFGVDSARRSKEHRKLQRRAIQPRSDNATLETACLNGTETYVTPACYRAIYNIDWNITNANTSLSILGLDESYSQTDLDAFLQKYNTAQGASPVDLVIQPSFNYSQYLTSIEESNLDLQTALGIAHPAKGTFYAVNGTGVLGNWTSGNANASPAELNHGQDNFIEFLHELAFNDTVPGVVSLSAGANEDYVPISYAQKACELIAAIGARGTTFIASTGDQGPISASRLPHTTPISPQWPATCPYVLAVGGTADPFNETALTAPFSTSTSGGGFSNIYSRPSWQDDAVPDYITNHVDAAFQAIPGFNGTGRGYPDVSALGESVPIVYHGNVILVGGTSASAPAWAGMIALLNDYEASRGRPTLGFVNPLLYNLAASGKSFRDIVTGDGNAFTGQAGAAPQPTRGYNASVGWDALTGLGVPRFDEIRAALP